MERNFVKDIYMSLEYFVCSKAGYKANKSIDVVVFLLILWKSNMHPSCPKKKTIIIIIEELVNRINCKCKRASYHSYRVFWK
jgi:hypothetical protein